MTDRVVIGQTTQAKYAGVCFSCGEPFDRGDDIVPLKDVDQSLQWGHPECVDAHRG